MKLKKLTVENFKGIRSFSFEPDGKDADVYGHNKTLKTTIFDAHQWIWFGRDSLNSADFDTYPNNTDDDYLIVLVEEILDTGDHIKKCMSKKFTTKRGSGIQEWTGFTYDYYINNMDKTVTETEFKDWIAALVPNGGKYKDAAQTLRLLTDPRFFSEHLAWKERRSLLIEFCGDVADSDVIRADAKFGAIFESIGKQSVDEYKESLKARMSKIKSDDRNPTALTLTSIPQRLDELKAQITKPEEPLEKAKALIKSHKKSIEEKEAAISRIDNNAQAAELKKQAAELDGKIITIENDIKRQGDEAERTLRNSLTNATDALNAAEKGRKETAEQYDKNHVKISEIEAKLVSLRAKWHTVNSEEFVSAVDPVICPHCGKDINEGKTEEENQKALEAFNIDKAKLLEAINKEGKTLKKDIDKLNADISKVDTLIEEADQKIETLKTEVAAAEEAMNTPAEIEIPPELREMIQERDKLLEKVEILNQDKAPERQELVDRIEEIKDRVTDLEEIVSEHNANSKNKARQKELNEKQKALAAEYSEKEAMVILIEEFVRTKCGMLDEKINKVFKTFRFKLFEQHINGGISDKCELTDANGTSYWSTNNASRIQGGMEVLAVAQRHYGIDFPVFIDNHESVIYTPAVSGQVISLYVSEQDKELRIVYK